eukprot:GFUD01012340.1.p1 GENE.GFUD01012340.1~~GFUD01012340.1.p1  ORF type:complete len:470 (-),score=74.46 GFUD01012340.1:76-1485(-)
MSDLEGCKEPPWKVKEVFLLSSPEDCIGSFCDLTFECFDGSVAAHKAVFGPLSSLLLPLLSSYDEHPSILLPDFDVEDIRYLLKILYTGEATCSQYRADKLLSLTKTLKMNPIPISYNSLGQSIPRFSKQKKPLSRNVKYGDQGVRNVVKKEMNDKLVQRVLSKTVDKDSITKDMSTLGFENNCKASDYDLRLCYICKAVVRGHNIFLDHLRLHREEGGPYQCPQLGCHSQEKTGLLLHRHFIENHLAERNEENFKEPAIANKGKRDNVGEYKCDLCCSTWTNFIHFKVHMNNVHSIRPLKCDHCEQRFNDKLGMKTHVQAKHMPERSYPCDICHKKYKTIRFLYHHRRQIHELGDNRVAKCDTCGFVSKGLANLKKHIKTVHDTESTKHQCAFCPSMFKSKFNLTCHERTHSGEAPYSCTFCGNKFKRAHHLKGHSEICKKNTSDVASSSLENVEFLVDPDVILENGT